MGLRHLACETWAHLLLSSVAQVSPALLQNWDLGSIQADGGRLWI